jgi:hypothetical protein
MAIIANLLILFQPAALNIFALPYLAVGSGSGPGMPELKGNRFDKIAV